ncbi:MAG: hypothetical protein AAGA76_08215, partial [Pseudomonadota bacterium]
MRIITVGLFAGFVAAIADPAFSPEQQTEGAVVEPAGAQAIDPIVTGVRVSPEHLAKWKLERKRYLECPECLASQP